MSISEDRAQLDTVADTFKELSVHFGGTEDDVTINDDGSISIANQELLDAMVQIFANKMREDGYSEEEVQAYIEHPFYDDSEVDDGK